MTGLREFTHCRSRVWFLIICFSSSIENGGSRRWSHSVAVRAYRPQVTDRVECILFPYLGDWREVMHMDIPRQQSAVLISKLNPQATQVFRSLTRVLRSPFVLRTALLHEPLGIHRGYKDERRMPRLMLQTKARKG